MASCGNLDNLGNLEKVGSSEELGILNYLEELGNQKHQEEEVGNLGNLNPLEEMGSLEEPESLNHLEEPENLDIVGFSWKILSSVRSVSISVRRKPWAFEIRWHFGSTWCPDQSSSRPSDTPWQLFSRISWCSCPRCRCPSDCSSHNTSLFRPTRALGSCCIHLSNSRAHSGGSEFCLWNKKNLTVNRRIRFRMSNEHSSSFTYFVIRSSSFCERWADALARQTMKTAKASLFIFSDLRSGLSSISLITWWSSSRSISGRLVLSLKADPLFISANQERLAL